MHVLNVQVLTFHKVSSINNNYSHLTQRSTVQNFLYNNTEPLNKLSISIIFNEIFSIDVFDYLKLIFFLLRLSRYFNKNIHGMKLRN